MSETPRLDRLRQRAANVSPEELDQASEAWRVAGAAAATARDRMSTGATTIRDRVRDCFGPTPTADAARERIEDLTARLDQRRADLFAGADAVARAADVTAAVRSFLAGAVVPEPLRDEPTAPAAGSDRDERRAYRVDHRAWRTERTERSATVADLEEQADLLLGQLTGELRAVGDVLWSLVGPQHPPMPEAPAPRGASGGASSPRGTAGAGHSGGPPAAAASLLAVPVPPTATLSQWEPWGAGGWEQFDLPGRSHGVPEWEQPARPDLPPTEGGTGLGAPDELAHVMRVDASALEGPGPGGFGTASTGAAVLGGRPAGEGHLGMPPPAVAATTLGVAAAGTGLAVAAGRAVRASGGLGVAAAPGFFGGAGTGGAGGRRSAGATHARHPGDVDAWTEEAGGAPGVLD